MHPQFSKIGVIGAGTMGAGVTADLLLHGIKTVLIDVSESRLSRPETRSLKR